MPRSHATRPATEVGQIHLAIVERHPVVRALLRQMVDHEPDIEIVAETVDVDEALSLVRDDPPDVFLIDSEEPIPTMIVDVHRLRREIPTSPIILLGHLRGDDELFAAIQAGAAAHVLDDARPAELVRVIRAVAEGEYLIDAAVAARPAVARHVLEAFRNASLFGEIAREDVAIDTYAPLSPREAEILDGIASGLTNRGVAEALSISEQTVKNHVTSILRKLAVNDRTQAVLQALRKNWVSLPDEPPRRRH